MPRKEGLLTIVSGLPRAGTSMMLQMLDAGGMAVLADDHRMPDEDNPKGYLEYELAKRLAKENAWLNDAVGKAVKIVAQLLRFLPAGYQYKVIFMDRELNEVVASQTQMLRRQERSGADLHDDQLRQVFGQQVGLVKRLLGHRKIPTLFVNHRDAIQDTQTVAGRVKEFLGVDLDESEMAKIVEPKLYRQREQKE